MADAVLHGGGQLSKGLVVSVGREDRVIAEAESPPLGEGQDAVDAPLDHHHRPVGPGHRQGAGEPGREVVRPGLVQPRLDLAHGQVEVPLRASPARRVHPRLPVQGGDGDAGIVGDGDQAAGPRGGARLDHGVAGEGGLGLVRFGQAEGPGGHDLEAAVQQGVQLARLARVMGGRHQAGSRIESQGHGP